MNWKPRPGVEERLLAFLLLGLGLVVLRTQTSHWLELVGFLLVYSGVFELVAWAVRDHEDRRHTSQSCDCLDDRPPLRRT